MPNVYVACWTMSEQIFAGASLGRRNDMFETIALSADTQLRYLGAMGGGAFTHMLVVPEYVFTGGGDILSRDDKHKIYKRLEVISARVPRMIIIAGTIAYKKGFFSTDTYNVCPVLHRGQIIKKLYKAHDDGVYQINGTFRTKTDGNKGVPVFTVNGITFGLDICMDFNRDRLATYLATNNVGQPHFHIQISGSNMTGRSKAQARVGGVYIHCDLGGKGDSGATAWRVTGYNAGNTSSTQIRPTNMLRPMNGRLMLFVTPV